MLTIGASANQNGSGLYEGVTVIFLAQVFGIDLSIGQQFLVVLMSMLAGVGTAGVPGGALPLIVVVMVQVGIPAEGIGLILGVDRFLDMCRTTLNVAGDAGDRQAGDLLGRRRDPGRVELTGSTVHIDGTNRNSPGAIRGSFRFGKWDPRHAARAEPAQPCRRAISSSDTSKLA